MAQTKEISLRTSEKELLLLIRLAKVTKQFLQSLDSTNPQSTDYVQMEEMQDHCYPPQEWSTNKITSKAKRAMVQEIARDFRVTSKQCWAVTS